MNEFDNVNSFLIEKGEKLFNTGNRSFKYGDGIFETIKVVDNKMLFWDEHYNRLKQGIKLLKIDKDRFDKKTWKQEIDQLIYKNHYKFAKLRLTVYRESPGLYTPMANNLGFVIEGVRYDRKDFTYKPEGISLGVYQDMGKAIDLLSNCKTTSALVYVMASIYKKEQGLGDMVVLNSLGNVCETSNANIFYIKDKNIFTPALNQGCVEGVFRSQVLKYCRDQEINVEEKEVTVQELQNADEIFVTNVISGVQGIANFQGKSKKQEFLKQFQSFFNELSF